jgi:hypothetical protein
VKGGELAKQGNERALAERVVDVGVESQCWELLAKMPNPGGLLIGQLLFSCGMRRKL